MSLIKRGWKLIRPSKGDSYSPQWNLIFWFATSVLLIVLLLSVIISPYRPDQFIYLARSFTRGSLAVDDMPLIYPDYASWQGHIYLPFGPLPAIVLIPFLPLIGLGLEPAWISIVLTMLNVWLFHQIFNKLNIGDDDGRWILLLFFGGTVYFSLAATTTAWYFAQIVATSCILLLILETAGSRRPLLMGFVLGLAAATRLSFIFALPFFIWPLRFIPPSSSLAKRVIFIAKILVGLAIPLLLLLAYNYARFGNMFETGYGIDVVGSAALAEARRYGLFSLVHLPQNLFVLLLQGPIPYPSLDSPIFTFPYIQPTPLGMGLFFTTPALVFIFRAKLNEPLVQACWLGTVSLLVPLMLHYTPGWIEFGFRYGLDFTPFLILIAVYGLPRPLNNFARGLIVTSVIINLWGTAWLHSWLPTY